MKCNNHLPLVPQVSYIVLSTVFVSKTFNVSISCHFYIVSSLYSHKYVDSLLLFVASSPNKAL